MLRVLSWIVGIPLAAVIVMFAVANRGSVRVSASPLPFEIDLPLYLVVLGALGLGLLAGALIVWIASLRHRHRARVAERRAEAAQMETRQLRARVAELEHPPRPPGTTLPAPLDAA